jgi:hypothetical protein
LKGRKDHKGRPALKVRKAYPGPAGRDAAHSAKFLLAEDPR